MTVFNLSFCSFATYLIVCTGCVSSYQLSSDLNGTKFTRGEECTRKCDGVPKICYYKLVIERYATVGGACRNCSKGVIEDCYLPQCVTADGFERALISVNRQTPGPPIQVCRGDRLIVDVVNQMPDQTTSIHWHGVNQNGSQHYDGVPYVTQCPISPGATFRYDFEVRRPGTYFYHSHTGAQKLDGLNGALIVRETDQLNQLLSYYDEDLPEHVMVVQDWTKTPAEHLTPGFASGRISQYPDTYLINGRALNYLRNSSFNLPLAEFTVEKGKRYRFRLIGSTCLTCAVAVVFQGHRVLAISADGELRFKPVPADTVVLNSGERFDVILEANQTEGVYLIHLQSLGKNCNPEPHIGLLTYKSVVYKPEDIVLPKPLSYEELGVIFNDVISSCDGSDSNAICVCHLEGVEDAIENKNSGKPYQQINIAFGFYYYDDDDLFRSGTYQRYDEPVAGLRMKALINNISFVSPPSPLISQFDDIPKNLFCHEECYGTTMTKPCTCANLYTIPFGAVVDLIIYDTGTVMNDLNHPFHLHGYNFYLLEMGILKENINDKRMELANLSKRLKDDEVNLKLRPMRDSVSIPAGGYVVIRFNADNPGFWILHCHFAFHLEGGMAAVVKVGNESQLPEIPHNFPKCGNF